MGREYLLNKQMACILSILCFYGYCQLGLGRASELSPEAGPPPCRLCTSCMRSTCCSSSLVCAAGFFSAFTAEDGLAVWIPSASRKSAVSLLPSQTWNLEATRKSSCHTNANAAWLECWGHGWRKSSVTRKTQAERCWESNQQGIGVIQ